MTVTTTTRDKILDAALACLADHGVESDRLISAVARQSGFSRPTVYRYFSDTEELKTALTTREIQRLRQLMRERTKGLTWSPHDITDLVAAVVEYGQTHPLNTRPEGFPPGLLRYFTTHADEVITPVIEDLCVELERRSEDLGWPQDLDLPVVLDFLVRLTIALVFVDTGSADLRDVRSYLTTVWRSAAIEPKACAC